MDEINETTASSVGLTSAEEELLEAALAEVHGDNREILPPNSASLLIGESTSRFSSATWFEEIGKQIVLLAGLGGIGSYVSFLLGRLKIRNLIIYDDDNVDSSNLSGQLFASEDVGNTKTRSVQRILRTFSDFYRLQAKDIKYLPGCESADIMICGFDNMEARRGFFSSWRNRVMRAPKEKRADCLFIDGRLAAEEFQVFCIKGTDTFLMDKYESKWLFRDSEAEETLCSYKQTSFCANMIASVMVNLFVNFVANKCEPLIERELPFYISYDAERMYLKTEMV